MSGITGKIIAHGVSECECPPCRECGPVTHRVCYHGENRADIDAHDPATCPVDAGGPCTCVEVNDYLKP